MYMELWTKNLCFDHVGQLTSEKILKMSIVSQSCLISECYIQVLCFISRECPSFILISKKGYGCTWSWENIQHYTLTQIKVKEQHFYCCSTFHSHCMLKAYSSSNWFFFILKVANIRCFILIAVEIFHYIIRK
jgi:hypothetical protein